MNTIDLLGTCGCWTQPDPVQSADSPWSVPRFHGLRLMLTHMGGCRVVRCSVGTNPDEQAAAASLWRALTLSSGKILEYSRDILSTIAFAKAEGLAKSELIPTGSYVEFAKQAATSNAPDATPPGHFMGKKLTRSVQTTHNRTGSPRALTPENPWSIVVKSFATELYKLNANGGILFGCR